MSIAALPLVERRFTIGPHDVAITAGVDQDALLAAAAERDAPPFGLMLWESAVALSHHIAALDLSGRRVLELGAGVGLAGIVAGRCGATVTQTDHDRLALDIAAHNATTNNVAGRVSQHQMDWHTWRPTERFDLILGADVLYDQHDHKAIHRILSTALTPNGMILLSDPMRPHTSSFVDLLAVGDLHMTSARHDIVDLTKPDRRVVVQVIKGQSRAPG